MDCGRPRQVSELWAALVRTTGLSNLPPWRACERTGQHLGHGEVTRGDQSGSFEGLYDRPGAPVSRRSPRSRAHRGPRAGFFGVGRACRPGPADRGQRRTRAGGCRAGELVAQDQRPTAGHSRRHNQQSGELVDQGQRRPRHRPGYIPAYGVVDDPPPSGLAITRPRRPPLTPLGRGRCFAPRREREREETPILYKRV